MKVNRLILSAIIMLSGSLFLSSCAVVKATNQPDKKDLSVLRTGTDRVQVIAELGKPLHTETKNGHKSDIFNFVQGYSKTNKTLRALGHGVADVYTLGLWEVVGTPIEGAANGNKVEVVVNYDKKDHVSKIKVLKGGKVVGVA